MTIELKYRRSEKIWSIQYILRSIHDNPPIWKEIRCTLETGNHVQRIFYIKSKGEKNEKVEQMDSRIAVYDACHNHGCRTGCDGSEGR